MKLSRRWQFVSSMDAKQKSSKIKEFRAGDRPKSWHLHAKRVILTPAMRGKNLRDNYQPNLLLQGNRFGVFAVKCHRVFVAHAGAAKNIERGTDGEVNFSAAQFCHLLEVGEGGGAAGVG